MDTLYSIWSIITPWLCMEASIDIGEKSITSKSIANILYALVVVKSQFERNEQTSPFHSLTTCVLVAYGGGIIVPIVLNRLPFPLANEIAVLSIVFAWYLFYSRYLSKITQYICSSFIGQIILGIGFETFRTGVMIGWLEASRIIIPKSAAALVSQTPFISWIICGTIGGCGGAFLPADKGLKALLMDNWNVKSAFLMSCLYVAMTSFAENLNFIALHPRDCRAVVASILCVLRVVKPLQRHCIVVLGTCSKIFGVEPIARDQQTMHMKRD